MVWGVDRSQPFWASGNTVPIMVATLVQTNDCQEPMCRAVTAKGKSLAPWRRKHRNAHKLGSHLMVPKVFPNHFLSLATFDQRSKDFFNLSFVEPHLCAKTPKVPLVQSVLFSKKLPRGNKAAKKTQIGRQTSVW